MHLVLLDINNLLCRAYFATINSKVQLNGHEVAGILGLHAYIHNIVSVLRPTHIAMARDLGSKTWRHRLYPSYKQNRPKTDIDLSKQFALLPFLARHLDILMIDHQDFEADDCIATLATQAHALCDQITIVSTDKDLYQLLNNKIHMYNPHLRKIQRVNDVNLKYNVCHSRLLDYFTLIGDSSDNLPGIKGIGPKAALQIISHTTDLTNIPLHKLTPQLQKKLIDQTDTILLMKKLITLCCDLKLRIPFTSSTHDYFKWLGGRYLAHNTLSEWLET